MIITRKIRVGDRVRFLDASSTGYKKGDIVIITAISDTSDSVGFLCPNATKTSMGEFQFDRVAEGGAYWMISRVELVTFTAKLRRKRV